MSLGVGGGRPTSIGRPSRVDQPQLDARAARARPTRASAAPPIALMVTTGPASVSPYPSKIGSPVTARNSASHCGGSGAPPDVHSRTPAVAARSSSGGSSSSARNIEGTPATALTRCSHDAPRRRAPGRNAR